MKRIRILSFQNAQNFGAMLQAYGLKKTIEGMGYTDVAFLNYNPEYLKKRYRIFSKRNLFPKQKDLHYLLAWLVNTPFYMINRFRKKVIFKRFQRDCLGISGKQFASPAEIKGLECNYLVCGSDQIWSTWITGEPDPVFYGEGDYKGLRCIFSYAASSEISTYEKSENVAKISKLLENFNFISVREKSIQKKLSDITQREIELCVDPTLLSGVENFDEIASERMINKPYILVYSYNNNSQLIKDLVQTIPDYKNYEVHHLSFGVSGRKGTFDWTCHAEVKVEEYISLFKYASYVVTNSFHGLAFSLLYHKPFVVAYVEGLSGRCESLLSQIGCSGKLVKSADDANWDVLDFNMIDSRIERLRAHSKDFIQKCLDFE